MKFEAEALLHADSGFRYDSNSPAGKLERTMKEKGVNFLGKFTDNGRVRSIDLSPGARAWRTLWTKDLSMDQLQNVHEWERKNFTERLSYSWEAREFLKLEQQEYVIKKIHFPILIEFNNRHSPIMTRQWHGLTIPPYFIDDLEFDGMEYQQAWDLSVQFIEMPVLPAKVRQTVAGSIEK